MKRLLLLLGILALPGFAQVNNYYISTTGSDSNNGLTSGAPWHTFAHANSSAALGSSGTVVHVAAGTYTETVSTSKAGSSDGVRFVWLSDTKWGAKIVPTSVGGGYAWYNGGGYSTIQNFEIYGPACHGIENDASFQNAIGNNVHNAAVSCSTGPNGGAGIDDTNYLGQGNQTLGNFVHDIGADSSNPSCLSHTNSEVQGIYHAQPGGAIINNLVVNSCADGISLWHAASSTLIINNTVVHSGQGINVGSGDAPCSTTGCPGDDHTLVYNNISANNYHYGYILASGGAGASIGPNNKFSYNIGYNNPSANFDPNGAGVSCTPGCLTSNPLFVNDNGTSSGDYHLQSTSPAIDNGTATDAPSSDFDGTHRPQGFGYDMGAYEFLGSAPPPTRPSITSLTATPSGPVTPGTPVTIAWTSTGGTSATLNGSPVALSGTQIVSPLTTTAYLLVVSNSAGAPSQTVTVNVGALPVISSFTASPSTIALGGSSTLALASTGGTSCSIDQGVGTVSCNSSTSVSPLTSKLYTVTVTNSFGSKTAQVLVGVSISALVGASVVNGQVVIH